VIVLRTGRTARAAEANRRPLSPVNLPVRWLPDRQRTWMLPTVAAGKLDVLRTRGAVRTDTHTHTHTHTHTRQTVMAVIRFNLLAHRGQSTLPDTITVSLQSQEHWPLWRGRGRGNSEWRWRRKLEKEKEKRFWSELKNYA